MGSKFLRILLICILIAALFFAADSKSGWGEFSIDEIPPSAYLPGKISLSHVPVFLNDTGYNRSDSFSFPSIASLVRDGAIGGIYGKLILYSPGLSDDRKIIWEILNTYFQNDKYKRRSM